MDMRWGWWKVRPCISASEPLTPYSYIPAGAIDQLKDSCLFWCDQLNHIPGDSFESIHCGQNYKVRVVQYSKIKPILYLLYFWCDTNESEKIILLQSSMLCLLLLHNLQLLWAPWVDHQVRYNQPMQMEKKESKVSRSDKCCFSTRTHCNVWNIAPSISGQHD